MLIKLLLLFVVFLAGCPPIPTAHALEPDKQKHIAAGIILGAVDWKLGCGAGLAKEVHDATGAGTVEFADFAYTCAGAGLSDWLGTDRTKLYRWDVVMILLDGVSTIKALHNGAEEVGWLAVRTIGSHPTDAQVVAFTGLNLLILEWSRSWHPSMRDTYQWGIAIHRPGVVMMNWRVEIK